MVKTSTYEKRKAFTFMMWIVNALSPGATVVTVEDITEATTERR